MSTALMWVNWAYLFLTFCMNHQLKSPATKQLGPMYVQQQIQQPSQGNLILHKQHFLQ